MKMSMIKQEQKSPVEIENLIKFTYSLKASLTLISVLPFKRVNSTFSEIITLAH